MLGGFNARVGSRVSDDDEWWYERGPHDVKGEAAVWEKEL